MFAEKTHICQQNTFKKRDAWEKEGRTEMNNETMYCLSKSLKQDKMIMFSPLMPLLGTQGEGAYLDVTAKIGSSGWALKAIICSAPSSPVQNRTIDWGSEERTSNRAVRGKDREDHVSSCIVWTSKCTETCSYHQRAQLQTQLLVILTHQHSAVKNPGVGWSW